MQAVAATEIGFAQQYLDILSTKSVRYGQDYLAHSLPSPLRIKVNIIDEIFIILYYSSDL